MATGASKINIELNRILDKTGLKDQFLDYLSNKLAETVAATFMGRSGTLDDHVIGLASTANDTFDLDMTDANKVVVGSGEVITLPNNAARVALETIGVPFANVAGVTYEVGIKYASIVAGVQHNTRTGVPEYKAFKDYFGESGNPDSVTDDPGVKVSLLVDSLTQAGVNHGGRKALAYLVTPQSGADSVAFYEGTITYTGGHNYLHIPYAGSNGPLGQDTGIHPPSTTAADYVVCLPGASWKAGAATIYGDNDYAFIGRITGNGPAATPVAFDTTLQLAVFLITLQGAYDGGSGSGSGRRVTVDSGAIELNSPAATDDDHNAQLRLNRIGDTSYFQLSLQVMANGTHAVPIAILEQLSTETDQPVDVLGATATFTAPGADLSTDHLDLGSIFLWIKSGVPKGLYAATGQTATTLTCADLQTGVSPAWAAASVAASVLVPRLWFSNAVPSAIAGGLAHLKGLVLTGSDGAGNTVPMITLLPERGQGDLIRVLNNRQALTGEADYRNLLRLIFDAPGTGNRGAYLQLGQMFGAVGMESYVHTKCGIDFRTLCSGAGEANKYALNIRPLDGGFLKGSNRVLGLFSRNGNEVMRWEHIGRLADSHRFREPFCYAAGSGLVTFGKWSVLSLGNGGTAACNMAAYGSNGDVARITTAGVVDGDGVVYYGPPMFLPRSTGGTHRRLKFFARARVIGGGGTRTRFELGFHGVNYSTTRAAFQILSGASADAWYFDTLVNGVEAQGGAGAQDVTGGPTDDLGWQTFYFEFDTSTNSISYWMTGMLSESVMDIHSGGLGATDWLDEKTYPYFRLNQEGTTSERVVEIDHVEAWDELIVAGPAE